MPLSRLVGSICITLPKIIIVILYLNFDFKYL